MDAGGLNELVLKCDSDGLGGVLGQYDGNGSIVTRVTPRADHDRTGRVTWHELHHYGLQAGTLWGAAFVAMVRNSPSDRDQQTSTKRTQTLDCARTVHEMYATYYTASDRRQLAELTTNPRYVSYWTRADDLRARLFLDDRNWRPTFESIFDCLMSDPALLNLTSESTPQQFEITLADSSPDRRYENLLRLLDQPNALRDLQDTITRCLASPATSNDALSEVFSRHNIPCATTEAQAAFRVEMQRNRDARAAQPAMRIGMGSSRRGDAPPLERAEPQLYTDALLLLSDIEALEFRPIKKRLEVNQQLPANMTIDDYFFPSAADRKPFALFAFMSHASLRNHFKVVGAATDHSEQDAIEPGLLGTSPAEHEPLSLLRFDDVANVSAVLQRNGVRTLFITTSSSALSVADLPIELEDLVVLVDGPRAAIAMELARDWMFLSYQIYNLGSTHPLSVIVACSGGRPSPRFIFVLTNITAMYLNAWFERQPNCRLDAAVSTSGLRDVLGFVANTLFRLGGWPAE